jgi:hypothetical protein
MDESNVYIISFFDKEDNEIDITPQLYGSLVNVIGMRATISYAGNITGNKVEIGVESVSSGWTRSSLQTAIEQYPTIQDQYVIKLQDKPIPQQDQTQDKD